MATTPRYATSRGGPVAENTEKIPNKLGNTRMKINPKNLHQSWFSLKTVVVIV
jgi:hypothetical protein